MKDEKQIVLFLKRGTTFNQVQLAAKLNEKISSLGIPVTLPFDNNNPNSPLIIFNKGLMDLSISYNEVSFIYEKDKNLVDTCVEIIDLLTEEGLDFVRFGYVSTYIRTKKDKEKYIDREFKNPNEFENEFNVSKYKSELIDSVRVNVWERNLTDKLNGVEFVTVIDINTPIAEEYNITSDFVSDFIKSCDEYIKEKL